MESLLRDATQSCLKHLDALASLEGQPEARDREKAALAEDLPRMVKYLSMLPGSDRQTFMPLCGGIRRYVYEDDTTYLSETIQELNSLLASIEKGSYRAIRETPDTMLWAGMYHSLNHLRNIRHFSSISHPELEPERQKLADEVERYRRYSTVARLTYAHRQIHEFIMKGLTRIAQEGDLSRMDQVEHRLTVMLVEY